MLVWMAAASCSHAALAPRAKGEMRDLMLFTLSPRRGPSWASPESHHRLLPLAFLNLVLLVVLLLVHVLVVATSAACSCH